MPLVGNTTSVVERSVEGALIGGTISDLTGGKFVNGAISGAIQGAMEEPQSQEHNGLIAGSPENISANGAVNGEPNLEPSPGACQPDTQCLSYTIEPNSYNDGRETIQWNLSEPSPDGGWIVQQITGGGTYNGTQVSETYWEAFHIPANSETTDFDVLTDPLHIDDTYLTGGPDLTINGSARFYEGLDLPPSFAANSVESAGILRATYDDPHLSLSGGTPPVLRTYSLPSH
jgi:hypothetical protein